MYKWIPTNLAKESLSDKALHAGYHSDGSMIYVGRIQHAGNILPAKVIPTKSAAFSTWKGVEISNEECEVLIGYEGSHWVKDSRGNVPTNAIPVGRIEDETLYMGRALWEKCLTPGWIDKRVRSLLVGFNDGEHRIREYEVLVQLESNP